MARAGAFMQITPDLKLNLFWIEIISQPGT
jgi:hypothetical protein